MSLWLVRAGKEGQFEEKFLDESRIYLTWSKLDRDLSKIKDKSALQETLEYRGSATKNAVCEYQSQLIVYSERVKRSTDKLTYNLSEFEHRF